MWVGAISLSSGISETTVSGFPVSCIQYGPQIMANMLDVTRADQTLASQAGYSVDIVVEVCEAAYHGSSQFRDESNGTEYDIVRTFRPNRSNFIQLYGRRRERGKV